MQDIRSGKPSSSPANELIGISSPVAAQSQQHDTAPAAAPPQDGAGETQRRIAAIMRDPSLNLQQKNERIQLVRSGKTLPDSEPLRSPAAAPPPAASVPCTTAESNGGQSSAAAGGIDWSSVPVPEPVVRRPSVPVPEPVVRTKSTSSEAGDAPAYQLHSPVHGEDTSRPPPSTPEEPPHPVHPPPVAATAAYTTEKVCPVWRLRFIHCRSQPLDRKGNAPFLGSAPFSQVIREFQKRRSGVMLLLIFMH